jgi:hypothetical protein
MKFCFLIPTMPRLNLGPGNPWQYVDDTLVKMRKVFTPTAPHSGTSPAVAGVTIGCDDEHWPRFAGTAGVTDHIPKITHKSNTYTSNYEFWCHNLVLDFCSYLERTKTNADYVVWMEDDTVLVPDALEKLQLNNGNLFKSFIGATVVIVKTSFIPELVAWMRTYKGRVSPMPLDWLLGDHPEMVILPAISVHNGTISSQKDLVKR